MFFTRIIVVFLLGLVLTACSMFKSNKEFAHHNAESTRPLEIPDGLIAPRSTQPLEVPDIKVDTLDLTSDLVEPPTIIKSVDLSELDADSGKIAGEAGPQAPVAEEKTLLAFTSREEKTPEGDSVLLVDGGFDQVWPAVGPALEELGYTLDDSSRGGQFYTISKELISVNIEEQVHPGDEKPPLKEEYQIHLKQVDEKTRITVHNKYGEMEGSGLSDHLLLQIKGLLENPAKNTSNDD